MADNKFEIILGILFFKISNADIAFDIKTLIWNFYTTIKALSNIEQVQLVNLKEFIIAALDADNKTFVVHIPIKKREKMLMHFEKQAQVGGLLFDEAPTAIPAEYFNYSNIFLAKNVVELPEYIRIKNHTIKLEKD